MSTHTIDTVFLLDASGSMSVMNKEPVDSFNNFVNEQKKLNDGTTITLYAFNKTPNLLIDDVPLASVEPLKYEDYKPTDMTALYDAIGHAITRKKNSDRNKDVVMVILTDGEENCSSEYTKETIAKMTKQMQDDYNWKFIYLGANQDSFAVGRDIGATNCSNFAYNSKGMSDACRAASTSISSYKTRSKDPKVTSVKNLDLTL